MRDLLRLIVAVALGVLCARSASAAPVYYLAGDFNNWTANGNLMTDNGNGTYTATITGLAAGEHQFKVTDGTWNNAWPGANSWLYPDGSGNVTITFNSNTVSDGWSPASSRVGVSVDPGTWTAVGDWQGWNNANASTAMTNQGGGLYEYVATIPIPGTYQYKVVNTGSWDAIGGDSRTINAATITFTTTDPNQTVNLWADVLNGAVKADVVAVPEPTVMGLLGLASMIGLSRRRHSAL